jgi:uncharacterized OB-fold protein
LLNEQDKEMSVLKGKCQECGAIYYGWALGDPCKRICPQCNHAVDILEDDLADRAYDIAMMSAEPKKTRDLEITQGN